MRDSYDPRGYRMARGWRHTKNSLYRVPFSYLFLACLRRFYFILFFYVLVGVPLIFSCLAVVVV